ncbi:MAG: RNA 2',3'-cyclic phosphodiesterase [Candidatus Binataceae bacterium]
MDALRNLATPVRAFLALKLGDQIESAIADFIDELRTPRDAVRWVPRRNLHLTVKFLGDAIAPARLALLARSVAALANETPPLHLAVAGAGAFPNWSRPRAVWVVSDGDGLATLAARVESAAVQCGFPRQERTWSPHLTIGRVRDPRSFKAIRAALDRESHRRFGAARVDSITLFRSTLGASAPIYEQLASFPFPA